MKLELTEHGNKTPRQVLLDVTVGDVYLFTGQSNVDLPESYGLQFNETAQRAEERWAEDMGHRGLVRLMIVPNQMPGLRYMTKPAQELTVVRDCPLCPDPFANKLHKYKVCHCNALRWSRATAANIRGFSALGWFSGAAIKRTVDGIKGVPVGLVRSSWGGTKIYRWSGPNAIAQCPQSTRPQLLPSALFSNMIHPMTDLQFSAVVWMHGASDVGKMAPFLGPSYYACALAAMIADWRVAFKSPSLPFVVVELPAYCNERDWATFHTFCDQPRSILREPDFHLPSMRIAQAAAEKLPHVYMVTSMDLGSLHPMGGSIHSDKKPELGQRVALAVRAAVYNDTEVIWQAPTALRAQRLDAWNVQVNFFLRAGERMHLNTSLRCPPEILPIYCTGAGFEVRSDGIWRAAASASLLGTRYVVVEAPANATGVDRVRYAYADWPICSLRSAVSGLPARIFDLPIVGHASGADFYMQKKAAEDDRPVEAGAEGPTQAPTHEPEPGFLLLSYWPSSLPPNWPYIAGFGCLLLVSLMLLCRLAVSSCKSAQNNASRFRVLQVGEQEEEAHLQSQALRVVPGYPTPHMARPASRHTPRRNISRA